MRGEEIGRYSQVLDRRIGHSMCGFVSESKKTLGFDGDEWSGFGIESCSCGCWAVVYGKLMELCCVVLGCCYGGMQWHNCSGYSYVY
jgi:hypothetical protein